MRQRWKRRKLLCILRRWHDPWDSNGMEPLILFFGLNGLAVLKEAERNVVMIGG